MPRLSRRNFLAAGITSGAALAATPAFAQTSPRTPNIDDFFRDFTADWVRHDPNLATGSRYFSGDEQDRLERQLTPQTLAWKKDRIQRARQGLAELRKFNRASLTETSESQPTSWTGNSTNWSARSLSSITPFRWSK
jgi:hypothetical protein